MYKNLMEDLFSRSVKNLSKNVNCRFLEVIVTILKSPDFTKKIKIFVSFLLLKISYDFASYVKLGRVDIFLDDLSKVKKSFSGSLKEILERLIKLPFKLAESAISNIKIPLGLLVVKSVWETKFLSKKSIELFVKSVFEDKSSFERNFSSFLTDIFLTISPIIPISLGYFIYKSLENLENILKKNHRPNTRQNNSNITNFVENAKSSYGKEIFKNNVNCSEKFNSSKIGSSESLRRQMKGIKNFLKQDY